MEMKNCAIKTYLGIYDRLEQKYYYINDLRSMYDEITGLDNKELNDNGILDYMFEILNKE